MAGTKRTIFGSHVLAFNGEIYNYLELQYELRKEGYKFKTTSDTEVLACALDKWGVKAFERLEGMWALAWYNLQTGKLILSRDRFGENEITCLGKRR